LIAVAAAACHLEICSAVSSFADIQILARNIFMQLLKYYF
jgi:hypothetical protein